MAKKKEKLSEKEKTEDKTKGLSEKEEDVEDKGEDLEQKEGGLIKGTFSKNLKFKGKNKIKTEKQNKKKVIEEKSKKEDEVSKNQNRILTAFFVLAGIAFLVIFLLTYRPVEEGNFEYRGINFSIVDFCGDNNISCLRTYQTAVPFVYKNQKANYNFYLRNDPRKLDEKIPFEGDFVLKKDFFVKIDFNQYCEGDETIAIVNFGNLHQIAGVNIINGENASCDYSGENTFVVIQEGDKTKIEQFGPSCYRIIVKECEILKGSERFMLETLVWVNEKSN
ncbi:hypothetical protein K0A97_01525 [Patescibacteria group bacterium]|nr:hypothetical protein [Patescibacteria group bacterium]